MTNLKDLQLPNLEETVQDFLDLIADGPTYENPVPNGRWSLVYKEDSGPLGMYLFKDESVKDTNRYKIIIEMDCTVEEAKAFCCHVEVR